MGRRECGRGALRARCCCCAGALVRLPARAHAACAMRAGQLKTQKTKRMQPPPTTMTQTDDGCGARNDAQ
jgi:hypothetical protein